MLYHGICSEDEVTIDHPKPTDLQTRTGIVDEKIFEEGGFAEVGVPHFVLFSKNIDNLDVSRLGQKYRYHPWFKQGTNVNFVEIVDLKTIKVRTYERGVEGETFSCGTGAMASALISHMSKKVHMLVTVRTRGGRLRVKWDREFSKLYLTGGAELTFEGQISIKK